MLSFSTFNPNDLEIIESSENIDDRLPAIGEIVRYAQNGIDLLVVDFFEEMGCPGIDLDTETGLWVPLPNEPIQMAVVAWECDGRAREHALPLVCLSRGPFSG